MALQVLELFSGTGSVGKVCNQLGWGVVSVDKDPKFNPQTVTRMLVRLRT